ncbi:hypothetical protein SLS54_004829 [Diplodia seriata]
MASTSEFTQSRIPGGILRQPTASSQFFADRQNRLCPFVEDEDEEEKNASITRPVVHFPADSPVTSIQLVSYWIDAADTPPSPGTDPDHAPDTLTVPCLSRSPIGTNAMLSSEQEADTDTAMSDSFDTSGDSPSPVSSPSPSLTTDQTGVVDSTQTFTLVYSAALAAIQQHQVEVEQRQANEAAAVAAAVGDHLSCPYDCERCNNSAEQLQYDKQQHDSSAAADILDEIAKELRARAPKTRKRKREWMTGCADDLANGEVEITTPPPLLKKARYGTGGPGAFGAPSATGGYAVTGRIGGYEVQRPVQAQEQQGWQQGDRMDVDGEVMTKEQVMAALQRVLDGKQNEFSESGEEGDDEDDYEGDEDEGEEQAPPSRGFGRGRGQRGQRGRSGGGQRGGGWQPRGGHSHGGRGGEWYNGGFGGQQKRGGQQHSGGHASGGRGGRSFDNGLGGDAHGNGNGRGRGGHGGRGNRRGNSHRDGGNNGGGGNWRGQQRGQSGHRGHRGGRAMPY